MLGLEPLQMDHSGRRMQKISESRFLPSALTAIGSGALDALMRSSPKLIRAVFAPSQLAFQPSAGNLCS